MQKDSFNKLFFTTLDFKLKVTEKIILPRRMQKGYLLRQSLGNALHKTMEPAEIERVWSNKLTVDQHKLLKISKEPPRGYLIEPPDTDKMFFSVGEIFNIRIILIGYVCEYANRFIDAFEYLGKSSGLGIASLNGCGKFTLDKVLINNKTKRNSKSKTIPLTIRKLPEYIHGERIKLNFITPAEIKLDNNKSRLMMHDKRDIPYFFVSLYKRLTTLQSIYCTGIFNEIDYGEVFTLTKNLEMDSRAIERINIKVSGKQLSGFKGELLFSGNLTEAVELIVPGEYLHIGTETVYGFGKYEIVF
jgi:hypothetical protein